MLDFVFGDLRLAQQAAPLQRINGELLNDKDNRIRGCGQAESTQGGASHAPTLSSNTHLTGTFPKWETSPRHRVAIYFWLSRFPLLRLVLQFHPRRAGRVVMLAAV
jgi:hypothetical protein